MNFTNLLQLCDDSTAWENPPGFDYDAANQRFAKFAESLSSAIGSPLKAETGTHIQDASFHSQIDLPFECERSVQILFSNFGEMATVSERAAVPPELLKTVIRLLESHGYVYVPESILDQPYTGKHPAMTGGSTWWDRYFSWG